MLITARANIGPDDDRGVIGHAHSSDLHIWKVRPPLSKPGSGFGHIECPQLASVDDRLVLLFSCLDPQFSAARRGSGATGGILYVPADSPTGPFDIAAASPLTTDAFYCGRIVHDRSGQPVLLAFHYYDQHRQFQGELSDPMPVGWENGELKFRGVPLGHDVAEVTADSLHTEHAQHRLGQLLDDLRVLGADADGDLGARTRSRRWTGCSRPGSSTRSSCPPSRSTSRNGSGWTSPPAAPPHRAAGDDHHRQPRDESFRPRKDAEMARIELQDVSKVRAVNALTLNIPGHPGTAGGNGQV